MLQKLNQRFQGVIAWVVVSIMAFTFALFGIEYYIQSRQQADHIVLRVNDAKLTRTLFESRLERAKRLTGLDYPSLKMTIAKDYLETQLGVQSALKNGFHVDYTHVHEAMMQQPEFQENGQFSIVRYQSILNQVGLDARAFQEQVRERILLQQQRFAWVETDFVLPPEQAAYLREHQEERTYRVIHVPTKPFLATQQVSSDEIQHYFDEHATLFQSPEEVTLSWVQLSLDDLRKKVKSSEEAQALFLTLSDQLSALSYQYPETLTEIAKAMNQPIQTTTHVTRHTGTDIGAYEEIRNVAFSEDVLALGRHSDPIALNDKTWVVFRVKAHVLPKPRLLKDVQQEIASIIREEKATQAAKKFAFELNKMSTSVRQTALKSYGLHEDIQHRIRAEVKPGTLDAVAFTLKKPGLDKVYLDKSSGYVWIGLEAVKAGDEHAMSSEKLHALAQSFATHEGSLWYAQYLLTFQQQSDVQMFVS